MEITFDSLPAAVANLFSKVDNIERLCIALSANVKSEPVAQALTIQQAAVFLSLTVQTLYGLTSKNEIPFSKKGKRCYFSTIDLSNWIATGRKRTTLEIDAEADRYLKDSNKKGGNYGK